MANCKPKPPNRFSHQTSNATQSDEIKKETITPQSSLEAENPPPPIIDSEDKSETPPLSLLRTSNEFLASLTHTLDIHDSDLKDLYETTKVNLPSNSYLNKNNFHSTGISSIIKLSSQSCKLYLKKPENSELTTDLLISRLTQKVFYDETLRNDALIKIEELKKTVVQNTDTKIANHTICTFILSNLILL